MEDSPSKRLIELIKEKAIAKWGEKEWFTKLLYAYVEEESRRTGKPLKAVQRRTQLTRLFAEEGKMTIETASILLAGVDGEMTITFTNPEEIKL